MSEPTKPRASGIQLGTLPCPPEHVHRETRLVVITGGPGAGKTAVLELAARALCRHVGVLPESAGILFGGGFPRRPTDTGRRAAQRAIYHVQREMEALVLEEATVAVALCDRGTIDGVAYWPGDDATYWKAVGTTLDQEISRYAAVIHLETPTPNQGYDFSNPLRVESAEMAHRIDQRIAAAWASHPRRFVVPSTDAFFDKATRALALIRAELDACCGGTADRAGM